MLNEKRIKEAESNIRTYLEDKLLWKYQSFQKEILEMSETFYQSVTGG